MSYTAKKRVNLEFISGELVEDIAVENDNEKLGAFIETTLIRLEVRHCLTRWCKQNTRYGLPYSTAYSCGMG